VDSLREMAADAGRVTTWHVSAAFEQRHFSADQLGEFSGILTPGGANAEAPTLIRDFAWRKIDRFL
jgi:hypothetical protein